MSTVAKPGIKPTRDKPAYECFDMNFVVQFWASGDGYQGRFSRYPHITTRAGTIAEVVANLREIVRLQLTAGGTA